MLRAGVFAVSLPRRGALPLALGRAGATSPTSRGGRLLGLLFCAPDYLLRVPLKRAEDPAHIAHRLPRVDRQLLVLLQTIARETHDAGRDLFRANVQIIGQLLDRLRCV